MMMIMIALTLTARLFNAIFIGAFQSAQLAFVIGHPHELPIGFHSLVYESMISVELFVCNSYLTSTR